MRVELAYGRKPVTIEVSDDSTVYELPSPPIRAVAAELIDDALDRPIASPGLETLAADKRRILISVSDSTRDEPRALMLDALRNRLPPGAEIEIAIANGTHAPKPIGDLGLPKWAQSAINHDSRDPSNIVEIGTTSTGTPLRVNRALAAADLLIATGSIRPHYFAGYGGGIKALFPGLGENDAIRLNHRLKASSGAIAGNVLNNPCRDDLEELRQFCPPIFLLNGVADSAGRWQEFFAGDVVTAHRRGCEVSSGFYKCAAPRSTLLVVSDKSPTTASLYQACKLVAAVAPLAADSATIVVAAECELGVGDDERVVNEAIFELGIQPRLPANHRIVVVSSRLAQESVSLFCEVQPSFDGLLDQPALVIPSSGASVIAEPL